MQSELSAAATDADADAIRESFSARERQIEHEVSIRLTWLPKHHATHCQHRVADRPQAARAAHAAGRGLQRAPPTMPSTVPRLRPLSQSPLCMAVPLEVGGHADNHIASTAPVAARAALRQTRTQTHVY